MLPPPTPEQDAILKAVRETKDSLLIKAYAGTGKTTTLEMIARATPLKPSLALAFNVKIKKELERRFPKHYTVLTMNGLGHRAWTRTIGKQPSVEPSKVYDTLKRMAPDLQLQQDEWSVVSSIVRGARHAGLVPNNLAANFTGLVPDTYDSWESIADGVYLDISDHIVYAARRVLNELISQSFAGVLDYDDQIYMPCLFGGVFPKFSIVLVDEAQDLSPLNHIQVRRVATDRIIVCGDPRQAIYAFRGADSSSMETMRAMREKWQDLPLSTTFRCPKVIVERQQSHAPGYNAAPSAPSGFVHSFPTESQWTFEDIEKLASGQDIAILCRNNAPIIAAALRIIRTGRGCTVLGSEIGKSLVTLSKKILPADDTPAENCLKRIVEWEKAETSVARANEKEERVAIIKDKAECLIAVFESGGAKNARELRAKITSMFQEGSLKITLATGHKSKGLEWPIVVHLDPHRVPSKFAQRAMIDGNPIPMEQDLNLRYVIETRVQRGLINAGLDDFVIEKQPDRAIEDNENSDQTNYGDD
jgi:DNA helicase-2/ATP-dependent DNA helicase PcrA